jgi:hypothetical protein
VHEEGIEPPFRFAIPIQQAYGMNLRLPLPIHAVSTSTNAYFKNAPVPLSPGMPVQLDLFRAGTASGASEGLKTLIPLCL